MAAAGFELFADKTSGPDTATGEIIDSAKSDSQLSLAVKSLQAGLNAALKTHLELMGRKNSKASIELHVQYDRLVLSTEEMRVLKECAESNLISTETFLDLMKRAGKMGPDFDIRKELERIYGKDLVDATAVEREAATDPTRIAPPPEPGQPKVEQPKNKIAA